MSGSDGRGARVVVSGVRRVHPGSIVALDGISLALEPGDFTALTGPSGSGKTSLLSVIGALDRPTDGTVEVDGELISDGGDHSRYRREMVGFVFQDHHLLADLTARANVELPQIGAGLGRRRRAERARELLHEVGLEHRLDVLARHLSGGERQRVAIARAIVGEPAIVLADEPTGNLDSTTGAEVLDVFRDLHAAGTTIVVITHDHQVAASMPRRITMRDGRIESDTAAVAA